MALTLEFHNGLYYCHTDIYTFDPTKRSSLSPLPLVPAVAWVVMPDTSSGLWQTSGYVPTAKSKQLQSKLWLLCLGSPGVTQLNILPGKAVGIPTEFDHHPFWFIDFKAQAQTRKQATQHLAIWTTERKCIFYMDFGFMQTSASDFSWANRSKDCVIFSYNGFSSYLLTVDEASCYIWVFLTHSKEPPLDIISEFLRQHGQKDGGCIQTDQEGELTRSHKFQDMVLRDHHYTLEPTRSNSPSQNSAVEINNDKFGIKMRTLLYGSGLPVQYWSVALTHVVFLHNQLVHSKTKKTPFEGYYGAKPHLSGLKLFGSRVCVTRNGKRRGKLDRHNFTGIFLGYAATEQNIIYIDLTSGLVKTSHCQDQPPCTV
jgi:hypothetical protein